MANIEWRPRKAEPLRTEGITVATETDVEETSARAEIRDKTNRLQCCLSRMEVAVKKIMSLKPYLAKQFPHVCQRTNNGN